MKSVENYISGISSSLFVVPDVCRSMLSVKRENVVKFLKVFHEIFQAKKKFRENLYYTNHSPLLAFDINVQHCSLWVEMCSETYLRVSYFVQFSKFYNAQCRMFHCNSKKDMAFIFFNLCELRLECDKIACEFVHKLTCAYRFKQILNDIVIYTSLFHHKW